MDPPTPQGQTMTTKKLLLKFLVARPAWGVVIWTGGEPAIIAGYASHTAALVEAKKANQVPGQSAEAIPIEWRARMGA